MIPNSNILLKETEIKEKPTKSYKMGLNSQVISGYVNSLKAMEQAIYKILHTERYKYIIYSWNYGVELEDLFGKRVSYVCPEIKRRITEALLQDKRIIDVSNFDFDVSRRGVVYTIFVVNTIFGEIKIEKEINY